MIYVGLIDLLFGESIIERLHHFEHPKTHHVMINPESPEMIKLKT
jgi:hypothetical protein